MTSTKVNLSAYKPRKGLAGKGFYVLAPWYITHIVVFMNPFCTSYRLKRLLLKLFGAKLGKKVVIKPRVHIKYPWKLRIGDHCWIGEEVWIDNLDEVEIGSNVCLSQGAMLLCGNHDYSKPGFDLMTAGIRIEEGAWVGARATIVPGCHIGEHAVVQAGSVAGGSLKARTIYRGNPAVGIKDRSLGEA
ncbi:MAG: colanic acid biosynthesis acetyltransferase WcaF [Bacteroidetes bacterium]|nr:MAG: colanic acid biosynthesis acetyltransferase WcaF [Bacteroidota bacterium]